jgi:hypothetical protein
LSGIVIFSFARLAQPNRVLLVHSLAKLAGRTGWSGNLLVVGRPVAAVAALLVERLPNSRVPRRVVRSGSWVARTSQAYARRSDELDREAGADKATYFAIRPLTFRQEARGELLGSCARLSASQSVHREHERSEDTLPSQAGVDVLVLLRLLLLGEDLVRILASVVRSVGICDANVEDSRRSAPPESVDADVAPKFWRWLCAWRCCARVAAPT